MTGDGLRNLRLEALDKWYQFPRHMLSAWDLGHHFQRCNSFRQQQLAWGDVEDRLFIDAFTRLPRLLSVSNKRSLRRYSRNENLEPPWRSLHLVTRDSSRPFVNPNHNMLRKMEFSEHHKAVYDYVLGRSGELPLLQEEA